LLGSSSAGMIEKGAFAADFFFERLRRRVKPMDSTEKIEKIPRSINTVHYGVSRGLVRKYD